MSTDRPRQNAALDARDDMLAIAAAWPDLMERMYSQGSSASNGMPKSPSVDETGIVLNEYVSRVHLEVERWVEFLARVLMDEVTITYMVTIPGEGDAEPTVELRSKPWAPRSTDTPRLLREIAQARIGHFTAHPDEMMRIAFFDDVKEMRSKVDSAAYPDGERTIKTQARCDEFGTSALGERVRCPGMITMTPTRYGTMPDLICSEDKTHRTTPDVFMRAGWRKSHEEDVA